MGWFNYLTCDMALPELNTLKQATRFQTKDIWKKQLWWFHLESNGRLSLREYEADPDNIYPPSLTDKLRAEIEAHLEAFTGRLRFYEYEDVEEDPNHPDCRWHEYHAQFENGKCTALVKHDERFIGDPEITDPAERARLAALYESDREAYDEDREQYEAERREAAPAP